MIISSTKKRSTKWEVLERDVKALILMREKRQGEVADILGVDQGLLSKSLAETKKVLPKLVEIVDLVKKENLMGQLSNSGEKVRKRQNEMAKKGLWPGPAPFGCRMEHGKPVPAERFEDLVKIFEKFSNRESQTKLAREYGLRPTYLRDILKDTRYVSKFEWLGEKYKGDWSPLIKPELFEKVQKMLPPKRGPLGFGYEWWDGKRVINPEQNRVIDQVCKKYLELKSAYKVADSLKLKYSLVKEIIYDERRTGFIEKDGVLIAGGWPQMIDRKTFEEMRKLRKSSRQRTQESRRKEKQNKFLEIKKCLPAYTAEIQTKTGLKPSYIGYLIWQGIKSGEFKRRSDDLIQFSWLPFPKDKPFLSGRAETRKRMMKMKEILDKEWKTRTELSKEIGVSKMIICKYIKRMHDDLEEKDGKFHLRPRNLSLASC